MAGFDLSHMIDTINPNAGSAPNDALRRRLCFSCLEVAPSEHHRLAPPSPLNGVGSVLHGTAALRVRVGFDIIVVTSVRTAHSGKPIILTSSPSHLTFLPAHTKRPAPPARCPQLTPKRLGARCTSPLTSHRTVMRLHTDTILTTPL